MAAEDDDLEPRKTAGFQPLVLDRLSIEELTGYIVTLRDEITRVEADIVKKRAVRDGAEAFFKK
jgi:uncharacterized small protein (DUF1192 family)